MSDISSCSDYNIWWWILPCIEIGEEFLLCEYSWINPFCETSSHTTNDLILTTITKCEDHGHFCFFTECLLYSISDDRTDIGREKPEISDDFECDIILVEILDHLREFLPEKCIDH